jgi:hypothetical protein
MPWAESTRPRVFFKTHPSMRQRILFARSKRFKAVNCVESPRSRRGGVAGGEPVKSMPEGQMVNRPTGRLQ